MRILFLGNNWLGLQVLRWLKSEGEEIAGLVVHPPAREHYRDEMTASVAEYGTPVFDGSRLRDPAVLTTIQGLNFEIALSVLFGYILQPSFLNLPPLGCINLHPSLLPYNRGAHPNVWSIIEETPAGATLHYVDSGIDTGDIIAQKKVAVEPIDTGETLYRRLEQASLELFQETWPVIRGGNAPRSTQRGYPGSYHRAREIDRIDEINLEDTYKAKDLINLLRARTFPPYPPAYFWKGGRKVHLRLALSYAEDSDP